MSKSKKTNKKFDIKKVDYRHFIIIAFIVTVFILAAINLNAAKRLSIGFEDFWNSCRYYWKCLWSEPGSEFDDSMVTVLDFKQILGVVVLPIDINVFAAKFRATFKLLVNGPHLLNGLRYFNNKTLFISRLLMVGVLPLIPLTILINNQFFSVNKDPYYKKSKPLLAYEWLNSHFLRPVFTYIADFWRLFWANKWYKWILLIIFFYNFNIFSVILTFLAWYFYFVFSFNFLSIYNLLVKILIDISPLLASYFIPIWIIVIYIIFNVTRIHYAYKKLDKLYEKNNRIVANLGVATGIYGAPGAGKNVLEVAMAIQTEKLFRDWCDKFMIEIRAEFVNFPWRALEISVEDWKNSGKATNKAQIDELVRKQYKACADKIYDYSLKDEKTTFYDALKNAHLIDELSDYAQLYFIYISFLGISSYSLRYDGFIDEKLKDHYPTWDYKLLKRDYRNDNFSTRAKIVDFDSFRMLKKMNGNNPQGYILDSGVFTLSEIAKERGNARTNQRRTDIDVKPSNDGFDYALKLIRHLGSVRNRCFLRVFWDDQRLGALGIDDKVCAETNIYIPKQERKLKSALKMYWIENICIDWGKEHYDKVLKKYITHRNDQTLRFYIIKRLQAYFSKKRRIIDNAFGYSDMKLQVSTGNINADQTSQDDSTFHIINKIVFSDRYVSACYSGLFDAVKRNSKVGINQLLPYKGKRASLQEIASQQGYFGFDLMNVISNNLNLYEDTSENSKTKEDK